jgi:NAD(P)-dependent dehydrogenase (short-subunit alcohol dehydrogenase family)
MCCSPRASPASCRTANSRPYNVTKAAVVALAESVAKDVRDARYRRVRAVPHAGLQQHRLECTQSPQHLGGPTANRTYTDEERAALDGRMLDAEPVAELVLEAIRNNELYVHTHREAQTYFDRRAARISKAFGRAL